LIDPRCVTCKYYLEILVNGSLRNNAEKKLTAQYH
jgi:hypothetical protein